MADVKKLAEELVNLKVTEVNELATILKEEYGIEPAAAAVVAVVEEEFPHPVMNSAAAVVAANANANTCFISNLSFFFVFITSCV